MSRSCACPTARAHSPRSSPIPRASSVSSRSACPCRNPTSTPSPRSSRRWSRRGTPMTGRKTCSRAGASGCLPSRPRDSGASRSPSSLSGSRSAHCVASADTPRDSHEPGRVGLPAPAVRRRLPLHERNRRGRAPLHIVGAGNIASRYASFMTMLGADVGVGILTRASPRSIVRAAGASTASIVSSRTPRSSCPWFRSCRARQAS